jgi:hypothetical protein
MCGEGSRLVRVGTTLPIDAQGCGRAATGFDALPHIIPRPYNYYEGF